MNFRINHTNKGCTVQQKVQGEWITSIVTNNQEPHYYDTQYEARNRLHQLIDESIIRNVK